MSMVSPPKADGESWFDKSRFGLFVHYGLYSVAARHEWVMTREKTPTKEYEKYAKYFDPDLFDAAAIAKEAKNTGMEYAVLTSKHHDGFCLFDTELTDYNSVNHQGRDLIREWVDALRDEGLKVGIYYSLLDWHHPDYTIDWHHPRRDDADAKEQNKKRNWDTYKKYLHGQVRELLTKYGKIDYLFFDFTFEEDMDGWPGKYPADWGAEELLAMCRELQPDMIVNDRLGITADLITPEQYQPTEPMKIDGKPVRWEACQTLNGSWGYDRDNFNFKSVKMLVSMLADTISKGGNLILNIGPDARGMITPREQSILREIGEWMRLHSRSIIGAGPSDLKAPPNTVITQNGDRAYVHVLSWPFEHMHLPNMADKVEFATLLCDGSELGMLVADPNQAALTTQPGGQPEGTLTLTLPIVKPDVVIPVIELHLKK